MILSDDSVQSRGVVVGVDERGGVMDEKKYDISQEIIDLFIESMVLSNLRDRYMRLPFGYKKAKRSAIEDRKASNKAWDMIYDVYPELRGKSLSFSMNDYKVKISPEFHKYRDGDEIKSILPQKTEDNHD